MAELQNANSDRLFKDGEKLQKNREALWVRNTQKECARREPFTGGKKSFQDDKKSKEGKNQSSIKDNQEKLPKERVMPWNVHGGLKSEVNKYRTAVEPEGTKCALLIS